MKQYSFLTEFLGTALGTLGLAMGTMGTIKNIGQNRFNNKYMGLMYKELSACKNRQQALQIVNRYTTQLTQMYNKMDKKTVNRVAVMQNFLKINFQIPLTKIINNPQDINWKQNALTFLKKNRRKINTKNLINTGVTTASLAAGGAIMTGVGGATAAAVASSTFLLNTAVRQLKIFNSTRYLNAMEKEIQNCPDDNRQLAAQILQKYCYDISNNIQSIVNKSRKKINFDIQQQMRARFLTPCLQIINNQNNRYWKVSLIDYIKTEKLQAIIQHVCDSITQLLIPRLLRNNAVGNQTTNVRTPVVRR